MHRTIAASAGILLLLAGCSTEVPAELTSACTALKEHGPVIVEGLRGQADPQELKDAVDEASAAMPSEKGGLDDEAYNSLLFLNGDLVLVSSEIFTSGRTLNTSLMDRMFHVQDVCSEAGIDFEL